VTTDAQGDFVFRNLADGLYLVTPTLSGYFYTPANCLVLISGPSVTSLEFTAVPAPHFITGTVTGPVFAGVSVALDGDAGFATSTDGAGNYTFASLANGSYTVTPSYPGYYFTPAVAAVTLAGANATGVDFVSTLAHRIAGHVTGTPRVGVTVTASGAGGGTALTDATGFYEITDLRDGGYALRATLDGFAYTPDPLFVDVAGADVTTADFAAVPTYTVSGTISGASGVQVKLTLTGPKSMVVNVDGGSGYSIDGLPNGSYMLVPGIGGFGFTPASRAFRVNYGDVTGQDFTTP
jgi:hypothetical protein